VTEELGAEARALLDAAREGMSPDAAAVSRVRARISVATAGAAAGTAIGLKLGLFAVVAAIAVGAGVYATRRAPTAVAPRVELANPSELPVQSAAREVPAPASADDDLITIETPAAIPEAAPPGRSGVPERQRVPAASASDAQRAVSGPGRAPTDRRSAPAARRPGGSDLAREVELVDLAMAALRRGDAGGALEAVRRHTAETAGRGQLAEDAAAIEIEALCRLHDPTTNAKLEAFDARFPRSAQRSRLTIQCP
jgi:hypothetical protein